MQLTSNIFLNNTSIPTEYTCRGKNISPSLEFKDVPANTLSLALIMHDPDAPSGDWLHWIWWDLDPSVKEITENAKISATIGKNDFGSFDYRGPCPPSGVHRYFFELYALNSLIGLNIDSYRSEIEEELEKHLISKSILIGTYANDQN